MRVIFNKLPDIAKQAQPKAEAIIREAAFAVERGAKLRIAGWPAVDTGAMLNSTRATKEKPLLWKIAPGVEYAIYVEFGTYKMAARPFLFPALEAVKPLFFKRMAEVYKP